MNIELPPKTLLVKIQALLFPKYFQNIPAPPFSTEPNSLSDPFEHSLIDSDINTTREPLLGGRVLDVDHFWYMNVDW